MVMDEYMNEFLYDEDFAPVMDSRPVDDDTLSYYKNKLPDRLLSYWKEYGFCGYGEGIYWTVNPSDYNDLIENWLKMTPLWGRENFYVISRTCFGELYVWGDKCCGVSVIDPHHNTILPEDPADRELTIEERERYFGITFSSKSKKSSDFYDMNDKLLFKRCLKKLGHLEHDEMYTFVPALAAGGVADIEHVQKVKIHEQLAYLSELDTPMMLKSASDVFGGTLFDD
jgi:hypothetical protein